MHSLTDGKGNLVCSCHCSTAAYDQAKQKKEERRKKREQKQDDREREKALANYYKKGLRKPKPCEMIDKTGAVLKRYRTIREASRDTGVDISVLSRICRGLHTPKGDFTFRYAEEVDHVEPI